MAFGSAGLSQYVGQSQDEYLARERYFHAMQQQSAALGAIFGNQINNAFPISITTQSQDDELLLLLTGD